MIALGVTGGAGYDNATVTVAKSAMTGTADVVNFTAAVTDDTTNAVTLAVDGFETINLALANDAAAGTGDDHKIAITNTNTNAVTLNVTGTDALADLTLSSIADSITTIDANGVAGSITMAARSSTSAMTITTGSGNDTVLMKNANDVLDGGTKAVTGDTDTLTVSGALVLGGIQVDLTSSTDQLTTYNGVANSAVQKNFENVDLSGITGFGAVIQAVKTGSVMTGTSSTDQITGGAGNDTVRVVTATSADADVVVGGTGSDTILVIDGLASNTLANNVIDLTTPGNGLIANSGAFANYSGFENVDVSAEAGDGFTIVGSTASNTIKGGAGADSITTGAGGTNTVDTGDGADVVTFGAGTDTVVVSAITDVEAANKVVTNNGANAATLEDTDTIALGAALTAGTTVIDVINTFTTTTDKIDLSAFGLTGAATATSAGAGATVDIADGKYAIIRGGVNAGTGVFTIDSTGVDSLLVFDGNTTANAVTLVGMVIDGGVVAAGDLILS